MKQNPNSGRSSLLGLAGGYLAYQAWELLQSWRNREPSSMPEGWLLVFVVLFGAGGIALMVYALRLWMRGRENKEDSSGDSQEKETDQDGNRWK